MQSPQVQLASHSAQETVDRHHVDHLVACAIPNTHQKRLTPNSACIIAYYTVKHGNHGDNRVITGALSDALTTLGFHAPRPICGRPFLMHHDHPAHRDAPLPICGYHIPMHHDHPAHRDAPIPIRGYPQICRALQRPPLFTFHFSPNHFSLPKKMVYSSHKHITSNDGYRRVRCTITDTEGANRALPTPDESLRSTKRYSDDPLESLTAPTEQPATRRATLRSTDRVTWHLTHSCVMERRHLVRCVLSQAPLPIRCCSTASQVEFFVFCGK